MDLLEILHIERYILHRDYVKFSDFSDFLGLPDLKRRPFFSIYMKSLTHCIVYMPRGT